jgi:hypothetical protein
MKACAIEPSKRELGREMKGTLVLLVLVLTAVGAIVLGAEPIIPTVRQLTSAGLGEPVSMVVSGAALLAVGAWLKRAA